jgi:hypothetical protein
MAVSLILEEAIAKGLAQVAIKHFVRYFSGMNYPAASSGVSNGISLLFSPQAAGNWPLRD